MAEVEPISNGLINTVSVRFRSHWRRFSATGLAIALAAVALACSTASPTATPNPTASSTEAAATAVPTPAPTLRPTATLTPLPTTTSTPTPAVTFTPTVAASATPLPIASSTPHPAGSGDAISAFPVLERFAVPLPTPPVPPPVPEGPFPVPTPKPPASANLAPHSVGDGFGITLSGADGNGVFHPEDIKISWWVANVGNALADEEFSIDVRFDGMILAQWKADTLARNSFIFVEERADLFRNVPVTAGMHTVELVIDSLDQIDETNELDNVVTNSILMAGTDVVSGPAELLPNLVPAPFEGKSEPIFVSSHPEDPLSGKLSVDVASYLAIGSANDSIHYINGGVEVDLYFDDLLVRRLVWEDISASGLVQFDAGDLRDLIDVSAGPHTLRLVVDPLNRVPESDETDNEYQVQLVWGVGSAPPAYESTSSEPPVREPTTRANLMPFRPFGWDAAITAAPIPANGPVGKDGWLNSSEAARIDFSFTNASRFSLPLTDELRADVLLDGELVERISFNSGSSNVGSIWSENTILMINTVPPGEHTVRVVLDPEGLFEELNEADNVFERTFTWHEGPPLESAEPFAMPEHEIRNALSPLFGELRFQTQPVLGPGAGERDWTPEIAAAGRAIYFLLTGRDVYEEGYVIHFLPPDEFRSNSLATCMSRWITMSEREYQENFDRCTSSSGEIGFKTRSNGQIHLFVDMGLSPLDALGTYLHELGHGLQDLANPAQTELRSSTGKRGLFEAQAQIFEAAGWRSAEEFMGERLSLFPDVRAARDRFEFLHELRLNRDTEHDVGYRLLWAQALSTDGDINVANELQIQGILSSASAMDLYTFLVGIKPEDVDTWAFETLARTELLEEFKQIASRRFIQELPSEQTGHPALQDSMWLAP